MARVASALHDKRNSPRSRENAPVVFNDFLGWRHAYITAELGRVPLCEPGTAAMIIVHDDTQCGRSFFGPPGRRRTVQELRAIIEQLMHDPSKGSRIVTQLQREDGRLLMELMRCIQSQKGRYRWWGCLPSAQYVCTRPSPIQPCVSWREIPSHQRNALAFRHRCVSVPTAARSTRAGWE